MSFGLQYGDIHNQEEWAQYTVVNADAHTIELQLFDTRCNYAPLDTFKVTGILNYHEAHDLEIRSMSDIDIKFGTDWWGNDWNKEPDLNSFEYADLGEGDIIRHTFGWFNLRYHKNEGEAQKIILTIPENTTGQIRGLRIYAGIMEDRYNLGNIQIFQLPKEDDIDDNACFPMKIRYKGKTYATMARINENDEYIYDDPEFEDVMKIIDSNPNIEAVVIDNTIVDYYEKEDPSYERFINAINRPADVLPSLNPVTSTSLNTRADGFEYFKTGSIGYYAAFSDGEFKGDYLTYTPNNMHNSHNLRDLKMNSMNDKISSIAVYYGGDLPNICAVLTVWENGNYNNDDNNIPRKKHRISFIATYNNRKISRNSLKNVKLINASGSWNDRISSLSYHFAYLDTPLKDY